MTVPIVRVKVINITTYKCIRGVAQSGLEHRVWDARAVGSNPTIPTLSDREKDNTMNIEEYRMFNKALEELLDKMKEVAVKAGIEI